MTGLWLRAAPISLVRDPEELLEYIAGWVAKFKRATVLTWKEEDGQSKQRKHKAAAKYSKSVQRDQTEEILRRATELRIAFTAATDIPRDRVRTELNAITDLDVRNSDQLLKIFVQIEEASKEAVKRLDEKSKTGRKDGVAAQALVHRLAAIWFALYGIEPTEKASSKPGTFSKFVDVVMDEGRIHGVDRGHFIRQMIAQRAVTQGKSTRRDTESDDPD